MNITRESNFTAVEITEYFTNLNRPRLSKVLLLRLEGKTLEECGNIIGVTRERIRQMESKALEMLRYRWQPPIKQTTPYNTPHPDRIESLELPTRTQNSLSSASIRTIGGLIRKTRGDILEIDGIGVKGLLGIKHRLIERGLNLKNETLYVINEEKG